MKTLIDMEVTAFLKEVHWRDPITRRSQIDDYIAMSSLLSSWFKGRLVGGALSLAFVLAIALIVDNRVADWVTISLLGSVVALYCISTLVSFIAMLKSRSILLRNGVELTNAFVQKPAFAASIFTELNGEGPISTARLRDIVSNSADQGILWPSGVWVMLDDLDRRNVSML
ncbi:MAG: hypothetical protein GKR99_20075 [Rhodobacteraceae bacterium]|nr:hypothetical protein [Paracoccaceae bacterium]